MYSEIYEFADEETRNLLEQSGISSVSFDELFSLSPQKVIKLITDISLNSYETPLKASAGLMSLFILFAVINSFYGEGLKNEGYYEFFEGALTVVSILVPLTEQLKQSVTAVTASSAFSAMYVPVFTALVSASGQPLSSFAYSACVLGFAEFCNAVIVNSVLPLLGIISGISIIASLNTSVNVDGVTGLLKKIITVFLSASSAVFVGLTNLKIKLSVSADSLTLKGIKTVAGGFIPIIGSSLGDAVNSTLSALSLIKNTVGVFGIIVIAVIFLPSVIKLTLWCLTLSIVRMAGEALDVKSAGKILGTVINAVSILNTVLVLSALILILTTGNMINIGS